MTERRLPVYLLLDCSESMAGPAIEAVSQGVNTLVKELRSNPLALETAHLSVITFSRKAEQVIPLTELLKFQPPKLAVRPGTALGSALRLLLECLRNEVIKTTTTKKGDYKPLVFLLTDGEPTDDWELPAKELKASKDPKLAHVCAIGCGPDIDVAVLRYITDITLSMSDLSPEAFRKLFVWLSASVKAVSTNLEVGLGDSPFNLPALPSNVLEFAPSASKIKSKVPRQVFLHARCSKVRKPYLMRFKLRTVDELYDPVASHPLEDFEDGDSDFLPPINSSLLNGCPSCPYCENPAAAMCPCGTLFCASPETQPSTVCPGCDAQLAFGDEVHFEIKRFEG